MNLKESHMKRMIISMIVVLSIQLSYAQENSTETKEITTTLKVYKQEAKKKDLQGLTEVTYFHSNGDEAILSGQYDDAVRQRVQKEIDEKGHFFIQKDTGVFVARGGA